MHPGVAHKTPFIPAPVGMTPFLSAPDGNWFLLVTSDGGWFLLLISGGCAGLGAGSYLDEDAFPTELPLLVTKELMQPV